MNITDAIIDALNCNWDGGAYGSINAEDVIDVEFGLEQTTFELSDERADSWTKYRTLPTKWVMTLLLKSLMEVR